MAFTADATCFCRSCTTRLDATPDDVMNTDVTSLSFSVCLGLPQWMQCSNNDYNGCSHWNGKPPFLLTSPLRLCVETERCDTVQYGMMLWAQTQCWHKVFQRASDFHIGQSVAMMVILAIVNDRKWDILPSSDLANKSGLCENSSFMLGDTMTHWI